MPLALSLAVAGPSGAVEVTCSGGDNFGFSVAGGQDFDGDDVPDIIAGAPCARAGGFNKAGRVRVFSGADGRVLLSLRGDQSSQQLGSAVSFVEDLNADGLAEVLVGSSGFNAPRASGGTYNAGGKVEVWSFSAGLLDGLTVHGQGAGENLGEAVIGLGDSNEDLVPDFAVGAGGADVDYVECVNGNPVVRTEERGQVRVISGADGSLLATDDGDVKFDRWGSVLAATGDIDGDFKPDFMVGSAAADVRRTPLDTSCLDASVTAESVLAARRARLAASTTTTSTTTSTTTTTTLGPLVGAGVARVLSGSLPVKLIDQFDGRNADDKAGRGLAGIGDIDGDGLEDYAIGSSNAVVGPANDAGNVRLFGSRDGLLWTATEPSPGIGAAFGTTIVGPGRLDMDSLPDLVISAPAAAVSGFSQAGRVRALSGNGTSYLWSVSGEVPAMRLGQSMAVAGDLDEDGVADVIVGAPGDAPRGRRGAGSAILLSGRDGSEITRFRGRRGVETRLFVAGLLGNRLPQVRSFDFKGRKREVRTRMFRGQSSGTLSMAVFDDLADVVAGQMRVVVGTGPGGDGPRVQVLRAGRRASSVADFEAFESYDGGVNVGAGEFYRAGSEDNGKDEIVAVQAESSDGNVQASIWTRAFPRPNGRFTASFVRSFPVFSAADRIAGRDVNARGAWIAAGNVTGQSGLGSVVDEIVVGTVGGLPAVRVLNSQTGATISQWLAYPPEGSGSIPNVGTQVAIGDLDGDGDNEIVTAPDQGELWIVCWNSDGSHFFCGPDGSGFTISVGHQFRGGLRLAVADVDLDGKGEILVVPGPGTAGKVLAYETDRSKVAGWKEFLPFGVGMDEGLTIAATNRFLRP